MDIRTFLSKSRDCLSYLSLLPNDLVREFAFGYLADTRSFAEVLPTEQRLRCARIPKKYRRCTMFAVLTRCVRKKIVQLFVLAMNHTVVICTKQGEILRKFKFVTDPHVPLSEKFTARAPRRGKYDWINSVYAAANRIYVQTPSSVYIINATTFETITRIKNVVEAFIVREPHAPNLMVVGVENYNSTAYDFQINAIVIYRYIGNDYVCHARIYLVLTKIALVYLVPGKAAINIICECSVSSFSAQYRAILQSLIDIDELPDGVMYNPDVIGDKFIDPVAACDVAREDYFASATRIELVYPKYRRAIVIYKPNRITDRGQVMVHTYGDWLHVYNITDSGLQSVYDSRILVNGICVGDDNRLYSKHGNKIYYHLRADEPIWRGDRNLCVPLSWRLIKKIPHAMDEFVYTEQHLYCIYREQLICDGVSLTSSPVLILCMAVGPGGTCFAISKSYQLFVFCGRELVVTQKLHIQVHTNIYVDAQRNICSYSQSKCEYTMYTAESDWQTFYNFRAVNVCGKYVIEDFRAQFPSFGKLYAAQRLRNTVVQNDGVLVPIHGDFYLHQTNLLSPRVVIYKYDMLKQQGYHIKTLFADVANTRMIVFYSQFDEKLYIINYDTCELGYAG